MMSLISDLPPALHALYYTSTSEILYTEKYSMYRIGVSYHVSNYLSSEKWCTMMESTWNYHQHIVPIPEKI
jgi:hypothetical protein